MKATQICVSGDELFALGEDGRVFRLMSDSRGFAWQIMPVLEMSVEANVIPAVVGHAAEKTKALIAEADFPNAEVACSET